MKRHLISLAGVLLALLVGCGGDSTGPGPGPAPTPVPKALVFYAAGPGTVQSGIPLSPAPVLELRDSLNRRVPKAGVTITASLDSAGLGGMISVRTDSVGRAAFSNVTITGTSGPRHIRFSSPGLISVGKNLQLEPGPAMTLRVVDTTHQSALVGQPVPTPPSVILTDGAGNPVSGQHVTFVVLNGDGTIDGTYPVTDATGKATVTAWRMGPTPGDNVINAIYDQSVVYFFATGLPLIPASVAKIAGDNQTVLLSEAVPVMPVVKVSDSTGAPLPGVPVTFAVVQGEATLTDSVTATDDSGYASLGGWHPRTAGANQVTATAAGPTPRSATFTATVQQLGFMTVHSDTQQFGIANSPVPSPPSVKVTDGGGAPIAGVNVLFSSVEGGGTIAGGSAVTDAQGIATVGSWTLSSYSGNQVAAASAPGYLYGSLTYAARAVTALPVTIAINSGDNQQASQGTPLADQVTAILKDGNGVIVGDYPVTFTAIDGTVTPYYTGQPGSASATVLANGYGIAGVRWIMPDSVGSGLALQASAKDVTPASITFHASSLAEAAAAIADNGSATSGTVGKPADVRVRVTDQFGAKVVGETVTFAITAGGGSVSATSVATDSNGDAFTSWTLGTTAGTNTLTATVGSIAPLPISIPAYADAATSMTYVSGTGQSAEIWHAVAMPPTVEVRDQYGNAATTSSVTFAVTAGGGRATPASIHPATDGHATVAWNVGPEPGANTLQATVDGSALPPVGFAATATNTTSPFNIETRVIGSLTSAQQTAVAEAVQRWRVIIAGDLPSTTVNLAAASCFDDQPAINETIDDVVIYIEIASIDGPGNILGAAGPCTLRSASGLPSTGVIQLDADDLAGMSQGLLNDLILHEMGHVLGFGTLWEGTGYLLNSGTPSVQFSGPGARAGYYALGGTLTNVPVENTGGSGTADSHWRESVFLNELMTGYIAGAGNPLTGMTIGSMADLGYTVDYASGEPLGFSLSALRAQGSIPTAYRERLLTSPIIVMDRSGTIVGRRGRGRR